MAHSETSYSDFVQKFLFQILISFNLKVWMSKVKAIWRSSGKWGRHFCKELFLLKQRCCLPLRTPRYLRLMTKLWFVVTFFAVLAWLKKFSLLKRFVLLQPKYFYVLLNTCSSFFFLKNDHEMNLFWIFYVTWNFNFTL